VRSPPRARPGPARRAEEFEAPLGRALDLHAASPDRFEEARTRLSYGDRLRRAGRGARAREQLRPALASFETLAATPWVERARAELVATGERARRRDPSTLDELTSQELQVGMVPADGHTTREAASRLFLSPKTVEYHRRNAYRKLGINPRDELARALRSPGC
jgi:DNA-binding NarL/FixJ family response regulator